MTKKAALALIIVAAAIFGFLFFSARFSQAAGSSWDRDLLLWLNSLSASHEYVWELANNSLFRGFPVFFSLVSLWFADDSRERRCRMLAGFLATCVATVLSVWLQFHLATHTRPFLDPALPLNMAVLDRIDPQLRFVWDRRDSFPSDTATLFFALATVILLENRLVGLLCLLWVAVIIAVPRVIFGWHYPTDIVGSLVLGLACVLLFNTVPYLRTLFERTLILFESRMYIVHALVVIFLIEASGLFLSVQKLGKTLVQLSG
ncbi:phosphatase PAP2 family protein [Bradyrhizobium sp. 179]|uniref:phosphatase PAP2 family protein n=1 Tax=Bradyrhizobium sp. 179 TaxID=2782648 RepID=UPI001FF744C2|nr:phosphatase PAP2 family protein [Bradyrhizobium sp. 179]MCK1540696.1 phosphatase PAP2 family protein [Bradyrhizobium sp. 179]